MPIPLSAEATLERYFLEMRSRLLDVGAAMDRIEQAEGAESVSMDERWRKLRQAAAVLTDDEPDRAARIQMIFSDPYEESWRRPPLRRA